jgi:hypothetical protein
MAISTFHNDTGNSLWVGVRKIIEKSVLLAVFPIKRQYIFATFCENLREI